MIRIGKFMDKQDAEMLKNLDLLLDLDAVEGEQDWDIIENMDDAEAVEVSSDETSSQEGGL